jgi:hypothetical protein
MMVERLLYLLGYMLAPVLFIKAESPKSVAKRLRFAYRLVGVKIIETESTDSGERTVILCPYRNLFAGRYGRKWFCHSKLDQVDEGYASYLRRHKNVRYEAPKSCNDTGRRSEYCCSEVSML